MRILRPIEGVRRLASRLRQAGTLTKLSLTLLVLAPLWFAARTLWLHHVYWSQHARLRVSIDLNRPSIGIFDNRAQAPGGLSRCGDNRHTN